ALRSGSEVVPAPAHRGRHVSGGVRHHGAGSAGAVSVWSQDQYSVCRKVEPRYSPAGSGGGASGQHALAGRGRLTATVGGISCVLQFLSASCEFTPAPFGACADQRPWLGQGVAPLYTGKGGGIDGSRMDTERSADVSRAAVAPAADGLRNSTP